MLICLLYLFSEMSVQVFGPFSNWIVCIFIVEFWEYFILYILDIVLY